MLDRKGSGPDKAASGEDTYEALQAASQKSEGGLFGRARQSFQEALHTGRGPARTRSAAEEGGDDPSVTADDIAMRRAPHVKPKAMFVPEGAIIQGSLTCGSETEICGRIEGDVTVDGRLHVSGSALITGSVRATSCKIEGLVEGKVECSDSLELGRNSRLKAEAMAGKEIILGGKVFGDVQSGGLVYLRTQASLKGNIKTRRFVMEEGAEFNGTCIMRPSGDQKKKDGGNTQ